MPADSIIDAVVDARGYRRLARLQLKALLRQVVTRIPDITVKEATWLPSIWFANATIIHMPVEFTPEQKLGG